MPRRLQWELQYEGGAELRGVDSSGEPFGYPGYSNDGNPFSNKIILMDEVHNLVRPSQQILRNPKRMEMLRRLRHMLRTATNSVIIGSRERRSATTRRRPRRSR